jgi:hypothetical protein
MASPPSPELTYVYYYRLSAPPIFADGGAESKKTGQKMWSAIGLDDTAEEETGNEMRGKGEKSHGEKKTGNMCGP